MRNRSLVFVVILLTSSSAREQEIPSENKRRPDSLADVSLVSGDIVCRLGDGLWSRHFKNLSTREKRFSHAGIIILESGHPFVVHASGDDFSGGGEVGKEPLSDFLIGAMDFAIYRIEHHGDIGSQIATEARSHIGKPFDIRFDLNTNTEIYCSQLIWLCVNAAAGEVVVTTSLIKGRRGVAIDDCYFHPFVSTVYDAKASSVRALEE